jgi:hypothetical protein
MHKEIQLALTPEKAEKKEYLEKEITEILKISPLQITSLRILHKSVDARSYQPKINLTIEIYWDEIPPEKENTVFNYHYVGKKPSVLIIGSGPAGLFAALKLIELGLKPIILERGKEIGQRKIDIATLNRNKGIDSNSNYCFGEGGAGTFSDGKLYTRSKKKRNVRHVLEVFHFHGAEVIPSELASKSHAGWQLSLAIPDALLRQMSRWDITIDLAKSTFPIFNRKLGLCGRCFPDFYTFSTAVDESVDKFKFTPAKRHSLSVKPNLQNRSSSSEELLFAHLSDRLPCGKSIFRRLQWRRAFGTRTPVFQDEVARTR